ncbi:non-homologous end-joining DNA ligase [Streptacidiphilus albus]|uniref:non-homologous end-joining DNA ligase n=1 Tax=Streptacidiphilus albus TaxID=105425 RepID=UPI00054C0A49|nr:non-homologous end-joining DNA ligase [Streptacidiphilus albus]
MPQDRTVVEVDGHRLTLSHLDRLLYPATGTSKAAVLHYYARAAVAMLPHLAGRPASFLRCPEGVTGERFWAKNVPPGAPDWVTTADVAQHAKTMRQVVVADLATLTWAANLAALEMHVPQWTAGKGPDAHDRLVVDLDPGEGCDVTHCCAVALRVRELLAADGLRAWAKTSGGKGLHLYAPVVDATAEQVGDYARRLAQRLEQDHPDTVVSRMAKALRPGKVFIDHSQNASSKTTACAYTLRATTRPAVSTPVSWEEVEDCVAAEQFAFTPEQVVERIDRYGDLLAGLLDPAAAGRLP